MEQEDDENGGHFWCEIGSATSSGSLSGCRVAVGLWINRPHVVNRRLCGTEELATFHDVEEVFEADREEGAEKWVKNLAEYLRKTATFADVPKNGRRMGFKIHVRELIPRAACYYHVREAVIIAEESCTATFVPLESFALDPLGHDDHAAILDLVPVTNSQFHSADPQPNEAVIPILKNPTATCIYQISWSVENTVLPQEAPVLSRLKIAVLLSGESNDDPENSCSEWLRDHLLPKLVTWSENVKPGDEVTSAVNSSLKLVPTKRYSSLHQQLKAKYGKSLVANWKECTDPQKFVSEDLGIAAYLLTLWEMEREKTGCQRQSFVDLGCGNGLLVHILSLENHSGIGIDVRRRKIWETFGSGTVLQERTFDPFSETLEGYDWIIGNHSDELTPWIPYVTARSSYQSRFFLLPCCAFDFNRKFNKPGNESEYQAYFTYLRQICKEVGFIVEEDILRIPSTKRRCFIGKKRLYSLAEEAEKDEERKAFLKSRLQVGRSNFVVKNAVEPVKNCSALPQKLKDSVIRCVVEELLKTFNVHVRCQGKSWNAGGKVSLETLASTMPSEMLKALKSQCGGLQTFIRNHQFIFEVRNAQVNLRDYALSQHQPKKSRNTKIYDNKSKRCWFFKNHPDGCPVDERLCLYSHG